MIQAAVLYYSRTGTTRRMAETIVQGMSRVPGVQAKACSIEDLDRTWLEESSCVIVGSPIYCASIAAALHTWLEAPGCVLAGKLGGAFATADYVHGGGDLGIQQILSHMLVFGMLTYSGGGALGKPPIHLGPVAIRGHEEECEENFLLYGQRMATMAAQLFDRP